PSRRRGPSSPRLCTPPIWKSPAAMGTRLSSFAVRLGLVVAAAVGIRLFHVLAIAPPSKGVNDALWYHLVAVEIAGGHGFTLPAFSPSLRLVPTAQPPPLSP